jgi:hypothetical protein
MKVKIFPSEGQTPQQAEEELEKAIQTKKEAQEQRYARESYQNDHLDQFHDYVMNEHRKVVVDIMDEVQALIKQRLGK